MFSRPTPQIDHAISYVREYLLRTRPKPGQPLPSHYALAKASGVSHITMLKGMRRLAQEGVLLLEQRKRAVIAPGPDNFVPPINTSAEPLIIQPAWKLVKDQLAADILKGEFRQHPVLPPFKQLTRQYGVSCPTVRKALYGLAREKLLHKHGRGYRLASESISPPQARIAVLGYGSAFTFQLGAHDDALISSLQRDAVRSNWELLLITFKRESGALRFVIEGGTEVDLARLDVMGFVYLYSQKEKGLDEEILRVLGAIRKPVAFFDEVGDPRVERFAAATPAVKLFRSLISPEPGKAVARYLLGLDRTRVAFVAPRASYSTSENRLAGLRSEFGAAGHESTVHCCTENLEIELGNMRREIRREFDSGRGALSRHFSEPLIGYLTQCFDNDVPLTRYLENVHLMKKVMGDLHDAILVHQVNAVVTVGDALIPHVVNVCRQLNKQIPSDIVVVSFDDLQESRAFRVPSYNFDIAAIACLMSSYVLWPNRFAQLHKGQVIDIPGYLVTRGHVPGSRG